MRTTRWLSLLLPLLAIAAPTQAGAEPDRTTRYSLENGLQVTLRPLAAGTKTAVCVVFDIGEDHDPLGRSGLAHLLEHCYVTSATPHAPIRTIEDIQTAYPRAWNAQTGTRYTVISFDAPKGRLGAELEDAAARMSSLRITEVDLRREKPRVVDELHQMFKGNPSLAARNRARELVRPSPKGGRKGGLPDQVRALTLDDLKTRHTHFYKPCNAQLVLVGPFDIEEARKLVVEKFGPIAPGEALPPARTSIEREPEPLTRVTLSDDQPWMPEQICRAYLAPKPDDVHYPAFLLLVSRLLSIQPGLNRAAARRAEYMVLDDPEVLCIAAPLPPQKKADEISARLDRWIATNTATVPTPEDRSLARQMFGFLLGTYRLPDAALANNPYGCAFGLARRAQLGIDPEALVAAFDAVDEEAWRAMIKAVFEEGRSATVAAVRSRRAR